MGHQGRGNTTRDKKLVKKYPVKSLRPTTLSDSALDSDRKNSSTIPLRKRYLFHSDFELPKKFISQLDFKIGPPNFFLRD